jgi:hypothetical protein
LSGEGGQIAEYVNFVCNILNKPPTITLDVELSLHLANDKGVARTLNEGAMQWTFGHLEKKKGRTKIKRRSHAVDIFN